MYREKAAGLKSYTYTFYFITNFVNMRNQGKFHEKLILRQKNAELKFKSNNPFAQSLLTSADRISFLIEFRFPFSNFAFFVFHRLITYHYLKNGFLRKCFFFQDNKVLIQSNHTLRPMETVMTPKGLIHKQTKHTLQQEKSQTLFHLHKAKQKTNYNNMQYCSQKYLSASIQGQRTDHLDLFPYF